MPYNSIENPLAFRKFIGCSSQNGPIALEGTNRIVSLPDGALIFTLPEASSIIALRRMNQIVALQEEQTKITLIAYDLDGTLVSEHAYNIPQGMSMSDFAVARNEDIDVPVVILEQNDEYSAWVENSVGGLTRFATFPGEMQFAEISEKIVVTTEQDLPMPPEFAVSIANNNSVLINETVLDLYSNMLLTRTEAPDGYVISCVRVMHNGEIKHLWSLQNACEGHFVSSNHAIVLIQKHMKHNVVIVDVSTGKISSTHINGHVQFGAQRAQDVEILLTDTVNGISIISLNITDGTHTLIKNILPAISDVNQYNLTLRTGGIAQVYVPQNPKSIIITLHGGPESFEWSNLRHGGLYGPVAKTRLIERQ